MDPAIQIALLWVAFAATHMGMSSLQLRPKLVGALGEAGFAGVYSIIALAIFVPLVSIYFGHKHEGARLYPLMRATPWLWLQYCVMGVAMTLLVAGVTRKSPAAMGKPGVAPDPATMQPGGVQRITRHAVFMAVALLGLAHLMVNPFLTDVVFFGGMVIFAFVGSVHQDHRKRVTLGEPFVLFAEQTPVLPFGGGLSAAWRGLRETPVWVPVIGVGAAVLLRLYHGVLFGGG
jgi:uncharacterized membrane protein